MKKFIVNLWHDIVLYSPYLVLIGLFLVVSFGIPYLKTPAYVNTKFFQTAVKDFSMYKFSDVDSAQRGIALTLYGKDGWYYNPQLDAERVEFNETQNPDFRYTANHTVFLENKDSSKGHLVIESLYIYNGFDWLAVSRKVSYLSDKKLEDLKNWSIFEEDEEDLPPGRSKRAISSRSDNAALCILDYVMSDFGLGASLDGWNKELIDPVFDGPTAARKGATKKAGGKKQD